MMWQSAAKCGLDPWNFVKQPTSSSQDPKGNYVRYWVPELFQLPTKYIFTPWTAPQQKLTTLGIRLGQTYPERIVKDIEGLHAQHAEAIKQLKRETPEQSDEKGYDIIEVPAGATDCLDGKHVRVFTKEEHRVPGTGINQRESGPASGSSKWKQQLANGANGSTRKMKRQHQQQRKKNVSGGKRKQQSIERTLTGASVQDALDDFSAD